MEPRKDANDSVADAVGRSAEGNTDQNDNASSERNRRGRRAGHANENSLHGNREISRSLGGEEPTEPQCEGQGRNAEMTDREKSDGFVVPEKSSNAKETMEGRDPTMRNSSQRSTARTQSRIAVSQELERVREGAICASRSTHRRSRMR